LTCARKAERAKSTHQSRPRAAPREGGTLRIPVGTDPAQMNPLLGRRGAAYDLWDCFYPSLLRMTPRGARPPEVEGDLARRWEWSEQTHTLTLTLRRDRFWQDTTRVESDDVTQTYAAYRAMGRLSRRSPGDSLPDPGLLAVEAADDSTVLLRYDPSFTFWRGLPVACWPVLPAAKLGVIDPGLLAANSLAREPDSAGPFLLLEWRPGLNLWLEPNPLAPPRLRPHVRKVAFERCPGVDARILRLTLGRADIVRDVPVFLLNRLLTPDTQARTSGCGIASVEMIVWNMRPGLAQELREAVSRAVDRDRMLEDLLTFDGRCFGGVAGGLLQPRAETVADSLLRRAPFPFLDRPRAGALLDAAGYGDRGPDGIRTRRGVPLRIEMIYDRSDEFRERLMTLLEEDLARVGIILDPVPLEGAEVWRRFLAGRFQSALLGFRPPPLPDLSSLWASWGRWNGGGFADAVVDSLARAMRAAEAPADLERLSGELEATVRRARPAAFLIYRERVDLLSPRVRDYQASIGQPLGRLELVWLADTLAAARPGAASR